MFFGLEFVDYMAMDKKAGLRLWFGVGLPVGYCCWQMVNSSHQAHEARDLLAIFESLDIYSHRAKKR